MNNLIKKHLIIHNREKMINNMVSKLFFYALPTGPIMFIITRLGIFDIPTWFCVLLTFLVTCAGVGMHCLTNFANFDKFAKYYGIIAIELIIGLSATQASVGIYIAYSFAIILSCLYISYPLTITVNIISYLILAVSLYFRALDQVRKNYIIITAEEYFIEYLLGYTIECILLLLISITIIRYEKVLVKDALDEIALREKAEEDNKKKGDFLAQMSHEIRTSINVVMGMNEMVIRETDDSLIEGYAESIKSAGKSLLNIVNDILDYSKISQGKMEIVPGEYDTFLVFLDLVNQYGTQVVNKGLDFEVMVDEEIPEMLVGDEYRIRQITGNLISNAIKYTKSGFVSIKADFEKTADNKGDLTISIVDSGMGIKPEDIPKLFNDYSRVNLKENNKIEGTGLGLKISKQIANMIGGDLTVTSVYGEGSVFTLKVEQEIRSEVPIGSFEDRMSKSSVKKVSKTNKKAVVTCEDASILIVDDNEMNIQVAVNLLKKSKASLTTTLSGKECIKMVQNAHFDLILLDHMMPEMDGIETLRHLKDEYADCIENTKVVVLTANAIKGAREKYIEEGFDDYISKPIAIEELDRVLTENLPAKYVNIVYGDDKEEEKEEEKLKLPDLSTYGIDTKKGLELLDNEEEIYLDMVKVFLGDKDGKVEKMNALITEHNLPDFTIMVHGLKSNARTLGADALADLAYEEEMMGKAGEYDSIVAHYPKLLEEWDKVVKGFSVIVTVSNLSSMGEPQKDNKKEPAKKVFLDDALCEDKLLMVMACLEELQYDKAFELIHEFESYELNEVLKECVDNVSKVLEKYEYDSAFSLINDYLTKYGEEYVNR